MPDYLSELKTLTEGSFLEELDELNLEVEYRRAVQNSIGYMLLVRCALTRLNTLRMRIFGMC